MTEWHVFPAFPAVVLFFPSEIKDRAIRFAQERQYQHATDERANSQAFRIDSFHIFAIEGRWVASFETCRTKT